MGRTPWSAIADDGPGIPEELIGRAFEPFFRVDLGRRQLKPGAGLGMAIAKEIIDQAGGSIKIANRAARRARPDGAPAARRGRRLRSERRPVT